jgi:hypothetical protein
MGWRHQIVFRWTVYKHESTTRWSMIEWTGFSHVKFLYLSTLCCAGALSRPGLLGDAHVSCGDQRVRWYKRDCVNEELIDRSWSRTLERRTPRLRARTIPSNVSSSVPSFCGACELFTLVCHVLDKRNWCEHPRDSCGLLHPCCTASRSARLFMRPVTWAAIGLLSLLRHFVH